LLSQAAQLQSLRSSLAAGAAGNLYGNLDMQVLLELMLLDAGLTPTSSSSSINRPPASLQHEQLLLQDSSNLMQAGMVAPAGVLQGAQGSSAAAAAAGARGEQAIAAAAAAAAAASSVTLSVLVSAAVSLPLVPG
jgi:hypothetical protein